ncbi:MAG: HupE/UreJ family protein [Saprospiraceae bacterium]
MADSLHYLKIGFEHVIPLGYDHILFIISLFFLDSLLKTSILQCSLFTLAHSFTLALVALDYISFNPYYIEIIIALSIFFVALENLFFSKLHFWRLALIFIFGLIHGMGFASALMSVGIPKNEEIAALLGFNLGVETAQILLIVCCYFCVARPFSHRTWYREKLIVPLSITIASIALFWTILRFLQ